MRAIVAVIFLAALAGAAAAQQLADPMRPPVLGPSAGATTTTVGPVLDMIIIGEGRHYAVIDGQTVAQGDRVGEARVVRIADTEVTLRDTGGESRVLKLLPQVQKKAAAPPQSGDAAGPGEEGKK